MDDEIEQKPRRPWTRPERWQVGIGLAGLMLGLAALVGQFLVQ
ncbi:hypothetical protein ACIRLA_33770 [Streptomyces sp. NPDC102364]